MRYAARRRWSAWTLVSRVTGLGRVIVIGAVLGPTFFANTFVATNTIPNVAYLAIAGTVLSAVVVPAIVRTTYATGTLSAADLLGRLAGFLLLLTGAATVLLLLVSPWIARLLTFGIADAATRSRAEDLTVVMVLFVAPQVVFYMIAFLGAAAQQARGRFALAAAAPAVENIGVMATVAAVGLMYGPGVETDDAPLALPILLCLGSTLSVALHMALQLVGAARVGLPIRPRLRRRPDPLTLEVTRRIRQSFVVAASPVTAYFTLLALAGTVPGGVLVLQMAYAVYSLPVALGGRAVSTAVLPGSQPRRTEATERCSPRRCAKGIAYAFIASLPPLFLLVVFASPIADILANGRLRVGDLIQALAGVPRRARGGTARGRAARGRPPSACSPGSTSEVPASRPCWRSVSRWPWASFTLLGLAGTDRLIGLSAAVLAGDVVAAATVILLLRRVVRPERARGPQASAGRGAGVNRHAACWSPAAGS